MNHGSERIKCRDIDVWRTVTWKNLVNLLYVYQFYLWLMVAVLVKVHQRNRTCIYRERKKERGWLIDYEELAHTITQLWRQRSAMICCLQARDSGKLEVWFQSESQGQSFFFSSYFSRWPLPFYFAFVCMP